MERAVSAGGRYSSPREARHDGGRTQTNAPLRKCLACSLVAAEPPQWFCLKCRKRIRKDRSA
jgi:hypothetical protein